MYDCESWTLKKAECRRIDTSELWCWRRLLRDPWTARRSIQSILKEISPGCSLEGLVLTLQYFFHLMWRTDSLENTLILGKTEGRRRSGEQMMWLLYDITDSTDMSLSKLCESVMDREAWHAAVHGVTENLTWLRDRSGLRKMSLSLEVSLRIIPAQIKGLWLIGFPGGSGSKEFASLQETWVWSLVRKITCRREWQHILLFLP